MRAMSVTIAMFTLLAVNAAIYAAAGRASETVDALACPCCSHCSCRNPLPAVDARAAQRRRIADLLRLIAAAAILWAAIFFVREREWLDAVNAWLWIGVVAVLELEVRAPAWIRRQRRLVIAFSAVLYAALAGVAVVWLLQGEWFDGYDAALWIAAFALLELDLLRRSSTTPPPAGVVI
jgi:hypothetical protein